MKFKAKNKEARGGARPNSGPTPQVIREACAKAFNDRIPILCKLADDDQLDPKARIMAIKELARVGVADKVEVTGKDGGPVYHAVTHTIDYEKFRKQFEGDGQPINGRVTTGHAAGNGN